MHRATSLIAAGALSLSLTPGIALAENGEDAVQEAAAEQQVGNEVSGTEAADGTIDGADALDSAIDDDESNAAEKTAATSEAATPQTANDTTPLAAPVAQIGNTTYATLDEAVAAAADGSTIELLSDATTSGLNLNKSLTVDGGKNQYSLTFVDKGIALWGKALTFKNTSVTMDGIGSTPYTAEWNWVTICASKDASLSLDNATLTMDGSNAGDAHAIYFCSNNKLNIENGSSLTIKNYQQDALEWDGGNGGYNVNISDGSTYISDHNRSGFTGTFYATIDNSTVKVLNSTGNGSNGTYYTIKNGSNVLFDSNGSWGASAWRIDMTGGSKLTATNNGYSGIWTRVLNLDSTCTLDVESNGVKAPSATTNAGITFMGNGTYQSKIESGAKVTIANNAGSGILTKQKACNLTIGSATIVNNGTGAVNQNGVGAEYGGGINNVGTVALDPSVQIYNNHATKAGDDLFSTGAGTTSFGDTGSDWILDDCNEAIDGWYNDPESSRWNAHPSEDSAASVSLGKSGEFESALALKAAHGLTVTYEYVGEFPEQADKPKSETKLQTLPYYAATQGSVPGWTFDGWYTDEACTAKWVDYTPLKGSMTLYGKWTKDPEPAQPGSEPSEPAQPGSDSSESSQPGSQTDVGANTESQQAASTEHLAQTGDATIPFGLAITGAALIAGALALISRKLLKH